MKIRISDIQVGDRVFDAGSRTYVEVVQKTLGIGGVTLSFADMPDQPMTVGGDITIEVQRPGVVAENVAACKKTIAELEAAGVVITGKDILDNVLQDKPELYYAQAVLDAERALNEAIRALPANMYVKATIEEHDIGRNHKMPFITATPCQEA